MSHRDTIALFTLNETTRSRAGACARFYSIIAFDMARLARAGAAQAAPDWGLSNLFGRLESSPRCTGVRETFVVEHVRWRLCMSRGMYYRRGWNVFVLWTFWSCRIWCDSGCNWCSIVLLVCKCTGKESTKAVEHGSYETLGIFSQNRIIEQTTRNSCQLVLLQSIQLKTLGLPT